MKPLSKSTEKLMVWALFAVAVAAEASTFYFTAARGYPAFGPSGTLGAESGLVLGGTAMALYLRNASFTGFVFSLFAGVLVTAVSEVPTAIAAVASAPWIAIAPGLLLGIVRGFGFSVAFLSGICWVLKLYDRRDRSKDT